MQIKWKIGNDLTQNMKQKNRNCATQTSIEFTPMHRENFCCIAKITNDGKWSKPKAKQLKQQFSSLLLATAFPHFFFFFFFVLHSYFVCI